jgi:hypothetical protein
MVTLKKRLNGEAAEGEVAGYFCRTCLVQSEDERQYLCRGCYVARIDPAADRDRQGRVHPMDHRFVADTPREMMAVVQEMLGNLHDSIAAVLPPQGSGHRDRPGDSEEENPARKQRKRD